MGWRDRLEPDGLPDAGDGVYQMPLGSSTCLPRGCVPGVGRVPDRDHQFLVAGLFSASVMSNVNGIVAAPMRADFCAVHPDRGLPIDRAEMQQHALALGRIRASRRCGDTTDAAPASPAASRRDSADSTGEGHQDLALERLRGILVLGPMA